jgi:hypothetical protein
LLVPKGAMSSQFKFGPAVRNEITPGRSPEMMAIPNLGAKVAMEVSQIVTADADNYFGRMAAEVPPPRVQTKQGMIVTGFLTMWTRAFRQVLSLAQRYMSDAEFSEVTGAPPGWLDQRRSQRNLLSAALHFDVRELDPEFVLGQLKVMNEAILPGDVAGVVDRAKYTRLQLRALSPALAKELVSDQGEASQKLFNDVQRDLAMMFLGNEAQYVENDPTAGAKLKFANQILMSNPNYQQAFKQGGRFAELLKKWEENLQFSLTQQQNAQIGSIGVKPEQMGMGGGMAR